MQAANGQFPTMHSFHFTHVIRESAVGAADASGGGFASKAHCKRAVNAVLVRHRRHEALRSDQRRRQDAFEQTKKIICRPHALSRAIFTPAPFIQSSAESHMHQGSTRYCMFIAF